MGVRMVIGENEGSDCVALYDSVSGWAFGPVFDDEHTAQAFLNWLPEDARTYTQPQLYQRYSDWLEIRKATV